MYIALGVSDDSISIYDTSDKVTEEISISTCSSLLNNIDILGITPITLEVGVLSRLTLHFTLFEEKMFDGILFMNYSHSYSEDNILAQVYTFTEIPSKEDFTYLCKYMFTNNKKYYYIKQSDTPNASISNYYSDSKTFDVVCPDKEVYNFSYFDIIYSIIEEDYTIEGLTLNKDTFDLTFGSVILTYEDGLDSLYSSLVEDNKYYSCLDIFNKPMKVGFHNVDRLWEGYESVIYEQSYGIPLFNAKRNIIDGKIDCENVVIEKSGNSFIIDGEPLDITKGVHLYKLNVFLTKENNEELRNYISSIIVREQFLGGKVDTSLYELDLNNYYSNLNNLKNIVSCNQYCKTKYGDIIVRKPRYFSEYMIKRFEHNKYIFLDRITHICCMYFDTTNFDVIAGNTSVSCVHLHNSSIANNSWENILFPFCIKISQYNPLDIEVIYLISLLKKVVKDEEIVDYGYNVIKVPLALSNIEAIHDRESNKYLFKSYLNEIIVDEEVFNHIETEKNIYLNMDMPVKKVEPNSKRSVTGTKVKKLNDFLERETMKIFNIKRDRWHAYHDLIIDDLKVKFDGEVY